MEARESRSWPQMARMEESRKINNRQNYEFPPNRPTCDEEITTRGGFKI